MEGRNRRMEKRKNRRAVKNDTDKYTRLSDELIVSDFGTNIIQRVNVCAENVTWLVT